MPRGRNQHGGHQENLDGRHVRRLGRCPGPRPEPYVALYGLGVFEGIRCYDTAAGPAIFRLPEHIDRLFDSAHIAGLKMPFSREDIGQAIVDTVKVNEVRECYIRPLVYLGYGELGINNSHCPVCVSIAVLALGRLPGRGRSGRRYSRVYLLLHPAPRQRHDDQGEGGRQLRQFPTCQDGSHSIRIRRGDHGSTCRATSERAPVRTSSSCATAFSRPPR